MARNWIAKNNGFLSWREFEEAQKGNTNAAETRPNVITTPSVSSLTDTNSSSDSDAEGSEQSSVSNVTENELREMQDKAGEIPGDSDYAGSDVDNAAEEEDEYEAWKQVETGERPWAFYGLRNKAHSKSQESRPSTATHSNKPVDAGTRLSIQEGMKTAHPKASPREKHQKCVVEDQARDSGGKILSSTNALTTNLLEQAADPLTGMASPAPITQDGGKNCEEKDLRAILSTLTDSLNQPPLSVAGLEDVPKGTKRARSEERTIQADMGMSAVEQGKTKKAKLDTDVSDIQATLSITSEPQSASPCSITPPFKPKEAQGPAAFELSSYSKGSISWNRESEESSLRLFYGEGDRTLGTVGDPVNIVIDPTRLRGFAREEIPGSKGNVVTRLLSNDVDDAPVEVVFNRPRGSKADIGKVQSRNFVRWLRSVEPNLKVFEAESK
ncbi:hypothetical protein NUW58_g6186 [Xylaria curta]|uniref:Uncharacterized protein n=1 Tax=Xylaria curta TaxID=42375 RepID=A0ACC1NX06_9PEZI|nr:hypothetical protein NUW58_g6186 [Xylaria curta]